MAKYKSQYITGPQVIYVKEDTQKIKNLTGYLFTYTNSATPPNGNVVKNLLTTYGSTIVGKLFKGEAISKVAEHMAALLANTTLLSSTFSNDKDVATELYEIYISAMSADTLLAKYPGAKLYARPKYREFYKDGVLMARYMVSFNTEKIVTKDGITLMQ